MATDVADLELSTRHVLAANIDNISSDKSLAIDESSNSNASVLGNTNSSSSTALAKASISDVTNDQPQAAENLNIITTSVSRYATPLAPLKLPNSEAIANVNNIAPATASTVSRRLFQDAAAKHGGDETTNFIQQERVGTSISQLPRQRSNSTAQDANISRLPSTSGKHEKKIGHRRVDEGGEVTYKKIQSKQIMGSIQLGIQHSVGSLASKPKHDLLMNNFWEMETISFPPDGSTLTPAHHYSEFRFKVYAPIAFRFFRDLFGIAPDDFLMSMCAAPLRELSNPGASGSLFYLTDDDEFIIKTVQKKECEFLQKLLPGYYMNLSQNPRTLLPKFFGLFCFHYNSKNVRLVAMNNLLPSEVRMHEKYDLKGSTFRRKASKQERQKNSPTFKDLDFMEKHPNGIFLEADKYNALMKTIQRDCMVLESFQIMDYSLLVGIHNVEEAAKEKREERIRNARAKLQRTEEIRNADEAPEADQAQISVYHAGASGGAAAVAALGAAGGVQFQTPNSAALNRSRSMNRQRLVAHSTAMESITADMDVPLEEDEDVPAGGIPARTADDKPLILFIGIIDILQSYRLEKKLEHTFKSLLYNGDTVSVCRPSFYAQRFQNFMSKMVFKKTPTFPLKHSASTRKVSVTRTPLRPNANLQLRPLVLTGSSTPPPPFEERNEDDARSQTESRMSNHVQSKLRRFSRQRSVISDADPALTEDEGLGMGGRSLRGSHSPHLSMTSVMVTTIGGANEEQTQTNRTAANGVDSSRSTVTKSVQAQTYTTTLVVNKEVREDGGEDVL